MLADPAIAAGSANTEVAAKAEQSKQATAVHTFALDDFDALWETRRRPDEGEAKIWARAVDAFRTEPSKCAFTMWESGVGEDDWYEARFDPELERPWRLISVGGNEPSKEQLAGFKPSNVGDPVGDRRGLRPSDAARQVAPETPDVLHRTNSPAARCPS